MGITPCTLLMLANAILECSNETSLAPLVAAGHNANQAKTNEAQSTSITHTVPTLQTLPRPTFVPSAVEQEEYIKEEQRSLKRELLRAQEEVKRIQSVPLVIGQFLEMVDGNSGIVGSTTGMLILVTSNGVDLAKHLCPERIWIIL